MSFRYAGISIILTSWHKKVYTSLPVFEAVFFLPWRPITPSTLVYGEQGQSEQNGRDARLLGKHFGRERLQSRSQR